MSWFTVLGLAADVAGAIVLAMGFLTLRLSAILAEGIPRYGANLWSLTARERERARVRIGVTALVAGFVLQLLAALFDFDNSRELRDVIPLGVALALVVAVVALGWWAGRADFTYDEDLELPRRGAPTVIGDQRNAYLTASLKEIRAFWAAWARLVERTTVCEMPGVSRAQVQQGYWRAPCPTDGAHQQAPAWTGNSTAFCTECVGTFRVVFPASADVAAIEGALLERKKPVDRNWTHATPVADLAAANAQETYELLP